MRQLVKENVFNFQEIENGVFKWHLFPGEMSLEDYRLGYNFVKNCFEKDPIFIIATHGRNFTFSPEAWRFMTDPDTDFSFMGAHALVLDQLHLRILAKVFIGLKKSNHPSKVFSNEEKALIWLKSMASNESC